MKKIVLAALVLFSSPSFSTPEKGTQYLQILDNLKGGGINVEEHRIYNNNCTINIRGSFVSGFNWSGDPNYSRYDLTLNFSKGVTVSSNNGIQFRGVGVEGASVDEEGYKSPFDGFDNANTDGVEIIIKASNALSELCKSL